MDFDIATIDVNERTSKWGPFSFSFHGAIPDPDGDPISSAQVKSYLDGVDTTLSLVEQTSHEPTAVLVWLNYPGSTKHGRHTLTFELTTQGGRRNIFTFGFVHVQPSRIA